MRKNSFLSMNETLKGLYPSILSEFWPGENFDAYDFIHKFQVRYKEIYEDYLERYGKAFLHSRLAWLLSKYDTDWGVRKIGVDSENRVSTWRKL